MQRNISPEPTGPAELKVPVETFTRTVNVAAGTELTAAQLCAVLRGEPATWLGIGSAGLPWPARRGRLVS
jgi:hypothetical protein